MLRVANKLQCSVARICALTDGPWPGGVAVGDPASGMLMDMFSLLLTPAVTSSPISITSEPTRMRPDLSANPIRQPTNTCRGDLRLSTSRLTTTLLAAIFIYNRLVEYGGKGMSEDQLSRIFAALADPTRRDMVARLAVGDATVGQLAQPYGVSVQAVSKHLRVLEDAGLVSHSRDAQRRPRHLEAEVFDLMTKWIEKYRQQAEERFRRLDAVLEAMEEEETIDRRHGAGDQKGAAS
jgi:DNA-binding transcriptional ArsR family regulator